MYLDHPKLSATKGNTEPDRIERINRVYGYAVGVADERGNRAFIGKLSRLHDHKGTLVVTWFSAPSDEEKSYFLKAWQSLIGDESSHVEHEVQSSATETGS